MQHVRSGIDGIRMYILPVLRYCPYLKRKTNLNLSGWMIKECAQQWLRKGVNLGTWWRKNQPRCAYKPHHKQKVLQCSASCPLGNIQGQVGVGSEQPDLAEDIPGHCRDVGLKDFQRSFTTQTMFLLMKKGKVLSYLAGFSGLGSWRWSFDLINSHCGAGAGEGGYLERKVRTRRQCVME